MPGRGGCCEFTLDKSGARDYSYDCLDYAYVLVNNSQVSKRVIQTITH